jgi:Cu(I)/Ag(I) efflux system membrane fusion protein
MKKVVIVIVALAVVAGAAYITRGRWLPFINKKPAGGFSVPGKEAANPKVCYVCPMHPQIIREKPGECPICGMSLVKKEIPSGAEKKPTEGMNMPGEKPEETGGTSELKTITLDPRERMLANVATSEIRRGTISRDVYTVGKIAMNEKTLRRISARYAGRIERLDADFTGEFVRKGQVLFTIYSPELVATQKEYLIAKQSLGRLASSGFPEIEKSTEGVLDSARERLKLWGVTDAQIERLDKDGIVSNAVSVYSPISGTVTEIKARQGDYVTEGAEVYTVADLSRVWMWAEVYEYEFSKVSLGSRADVTVEAFPGKTFTGRVDFIDPAVNPESRTVRVRVDLMNKGGMLKPEMFVNARIFSKPLTGLIAPASAILYTGRGDVAWVEESPGVFTMREVTVGMRSGDNFQIISGLHEGDNVVTQGGFLIDSEAQLRESAGGGMAGMPGMEMGGEQKKPAPAPKGEAAPKGGDMKGMPGM